MSGSGETPRVPVGPPGESPDEDDGPDAQQRRAERSAQVMFDGDLASRHLGITLERVAPGFARMRMQVTDTMINGHGICHGGYLFTFADSAFAFACNSYNRVSVGASAQVEFLAPARAGDVLYAEARVRNRGRRSGIYDVVIENEQAWQLLLFRGRSHRLDETLFDESVPAGESGDGSVKTDRTGMTGMTSEEPTQ